MSEIAKCSSVKSLVAVLKFTLNVLVHLRKTCDEKQGKWYEIRSRCNLLTIHAAQHASRVTTYLALFELYALVLRSELVRDSEHVLQRLLRKIKSHDSAMSQDFKLEKQFCENIVSVSSTIFDTTQESCSSDCASSVRRTWCSSAKRENISFLIHLLRGLTLVTPLYHSNST